MAFVAPIVPVPVLLQDDDASFSTILMRCGFDNPVHAQLFQTMVARNLGALAAIPRENLVKELTSFRKTANGTSVPAARRFYLMPIQYNNIQSVRNWADIAIIQGGSVYYDHQIGLFDEEWMKQVAAEFSNESLDAAPAQTDEKAVTIPQFNGVNWHEVKDSIIRALQIKRGAAGIPLAYLVRTDRVIFSENDASLSVVEKRISSQKHSGPLFDRDNRDLYQFLANTFNNTSLSALVKGVSNSNGLKAWEALISNCQGASYAMEVKNRAKTLLDNSFYDGKSAQFTFAQYYELHVKAHNMLQALGRDYEMSEEEKIFNFVAHLKEPTLMNTYLSNRNNSVCQTFRGLYEFMDGGLRILNPLGKGRALKVNGRNGQRIMAGFETGGRGRGRGRGRGGREGGRHAGRGGRGRDGGRGRHGRGRNSSHYSPYNKDKKYEALPANINTNDYVPQSVLDGLTEGQRNTFYELRRNPAAASIISSLQSTIASTRTESIPSEIGSGAASTAGTSSGTPPSQAGRGFGRGARQN